MMRTAGVMMLFVCFAAGNRVQNIDDEVDEWFEDVNEKLTIHHEGLRQIPDFSFAGTNLTKGVQIGANSLIRTGECSLTFASDKSSVTADLHIGLRLMAVAYAHIKNEVYDTSGFLRVRNNSMHLTYTYTHSPKCDFTVQTYELEALTDATVESSGFHDPIDVSVPLTQTLLPYVNEKLSQVKGKMEAYYREMICRYHPSVEEHLSVLLQNAQNINLF